MNHPDGPHGQHEGPLDYLAGCIAVIVVIGVCAVIIVPLTIFVQMVWELWRGG